jgi:uncharacterized protein GlcG (DUF336 family)
VSNKRKFCLKIKLIVSSVPIYHEGRLIGGVGVSGGTVAQDVEVALAGLAGIGASSTAPTYR